MSKSLREAINAKCKQCVYDPYAGGGWRQQVRDCMGVNCALYQVRAVPGGNAASKSSGAKPKSAS